VKSRRLLFLVLLVVSLDFAVPYEPTARGWQEFEDEEESVHPEGRRLERPRATAAQPSAGAASISRSRPAAAAARQASRQAGVPVTRLARADTSSSLPPASPEAH
jgi:hypothetical protein